MTCRSIAATAVIVGVLLAAFVRASAAQNLHAVSPDGKMVAFVRGDTLWLTSTFPRRAPQKLAVISKYFAVPRWSPSSQQLAYYSKQSGTLQLWSYDLRTRTSRQIGSVEGGIAPDPNGSLTGWVNDALRYSWSPDGSKIAFATQVPVGDSGKPSASGTSRFPSAEQLAAGNPIVLTRATPPEWTIHGVVSYGTEVSFSDATLDWKWAPQIRPRRSTQLFVLDLASGHATQLTKDTAQYFTPEWSPDGARLAYVSVEGRALYGGQGPEESNIYTFDLASGRKTKITQGFTQKTLPRWSPDGKWIAYLGYDKTGKFSRRDEGVYVVRSSGADSARWVSRELDRYVIAYEWAPDASAVLLTYRDGLVSPLARADVQTGALSPVSPPSADVEGFGASVGGVVWTAVAGPNDATMLWFGHPHGPSRVLAQLQAPPDFGRERRYETLRWTNTHGETIDGLLIYPLNYVAGQAYPLLVDAYGQASISRGRYDWLNYIKASPNYLIFAPNHRAPHMWGNPMKSATYDAAAVGPNGIRIMADDILSGVDEIIKRGLVDPGRMCVVGFSNGGLQGEQLLTQTNRFKCAVFQSPAVSDWLVTCFLNPEGPAGVMWFMYGTAPWEDPSTYISLIPLFHAEMITTPTLLAVGDLEPGVIPTIEMYNVLRYLKKDVTLLRYTTQGHVFTGAADEDFQRRVAAFLSSYLGSTSEHSTHSDRSGMTAPDGAH